MSYLEMVKEDVKQYMEDNEQFFDFSNYADADDFEQDLNEKLWVEDSVTGNASGSYTFNRAEAEEIVKENLSEVITACNEFCVSAETFGEKVFNEEWEFLDVTARCYFLGQAIAEYVEENKEEIEQAIEQANE